MVSKLLEYFLEYLKGRAYWPLIQPVFALVALYVASCVIAYQYIEWRFHFAPELSTFIRSYIVKQISVIGAGVALLVLFLGVNWQSRARDEAALRLIGWVRSGAMKLVAAAFIVVTTTGLFLHLIPHPVSLIKITFLEQPVSFDQNAFAYIVYEINRMQSAWHFTLDPDIFIRESGTSKELERCGSDPLCYAKLISKEEPLIGITESGFDQ